MNEHTLQFAKPWIPQRADPFVVRDGAGNYYFTASVPSYDKIVLRRAGSLAELPAAPERVLWTAHERGAQSMHIWAPELHRLFGKWYIYYAGGDKEHPWRIRPYALECQSDDPMAGPWVEKGKLRAAGEDKFSFRAFSLDATVFECGGVWYCVWAEKVGVGKQISNLYIARMKNGWTMDTVQVMLTTPDYDWERYGFWVNEGPAVIERDGRVFLTYSASDTGVNYCMGMLTASADADLLDPLSWKKERRPVLRTDPERGVYGPGHNSFTVDGEGRDILVFHARTEPEITGNPLYNPNRHAMLLPVRWADGRPVFSFEDAL